MKKELHPRNKFKLLAQGVLILFCLVFTEGIITQPVSELVMENTIETIDSEVTEEEGEDENHTPVGFTAKFSVEETHLGNVQSGCTFFKSFFKLPTPEDISPPPKLV